MAYSTYTDVQSLIKWCVFSGTSKVTTSEITSTHIANADALIDGYLSKLYVLPITDTGALKVLNYISVRFAACAVAKILVLQTSGELPPIVQTWCDEANARLKEILKKDIILANEVLKDTTRGLSIYPADDPIWKLGEDQW